MVHHIEDDGLGRDVPWNVSTQAKADFATRRNPGPQAETFPEGLPMVESGKEDEAVPSGACSDPGEGGVTWTFSKTSASGGT